MSLSWLDLSWLDILSWLNLSWLDMYCLDLSWHYLSWLDLVWLDISRLDLSWLDLCWLDLSRLDLSWLDFFLLDLPDWTCPGMTYPDLTDPELTSIDSTLPDLTCPDRTCPKQTNLISVLLVTPPLTAMYVLLTGSRLLNNISIPAHYSGESPGRFQAISWYNLLFYITSVYQIHLWVVVTLFFLDCSTIVTVALCCLNTWSPLWWITSSSLLSCTPTLPSLPLPSKTAKDDLLNGEPIHSLSSQI